MTDAWEDIRREMYREKRRCRLEHREFDVADALAGLAHALHIPAPRVPTAFVAAVTDSLPVCLPGCTGNCTQEHQP